MNIAFAWWWTWWHVFPIRTLIKYIQKNNNNSNKIFWFWEKNSLEDEISRECDCEFVPIVSWKFRREKNIVSILKNIIDIFKFWYWTLVSIYLIWKHKIDTIFCKWWYVALPVVVWWWILRKKIIVHESDSVMGLTNKIASKLSNFKYSWMDHKWFENIWQIISSDLLSFDSIDTKLKKTDTKTNILVSWWSQWSRYIYKNLINAIKENPSLQNHFNFFVVLGTANKDLKEQFESINWVEVFEFLTQWQMWSLYNLCDIGITRWWATSLAEQKLFNMRLIIIPLPFTWWNHQFHNAIQYQKKYNDILISQKHFSKEIVSSSLNKFINYKKEQPNLSEINNKINKNIEKILWISW